MDDLPCTGEPARFPLPMAYADPAFVYCAHEAIETPELVEQFNRLYGATLGARVSPIEAMVDKATGKAEADMKAFTEFVHDAIYMRLPDDALHAIRAAVMSKAGSV